MIEVEASSVSDRFSEIGDTEGGRAAVWDAQPLSFFTSTSRGVNVDRPKNIVFSRISWVSIILIVLPILDNVMQADIFRDYPIVASAFGLVILILRRFTSQPVRVLPKPD